MPGFTQYLSLRYPLITEIVTAQSYQDLANDIDAQFTATDTIRQLNLHRSSCSVFGGTTATTVAAFTNIAFTSSSWTVPAALHSTSVNPEQFVIQTAGLYYFSATLSVNGATTVTGFEVGQSKNGTSNFFETGQTFPLSGIATVKGLQFCNAGDILRILARWSGTGGPANVGGNAQLYMIAQL